MPPRKFSRYSFTQGVRSGSSPRFLTPREPVRFRQMPDNAEHVVRRGDTLWSLAGRYFRGFYRPSGLWWVIADFQPQVIHDPTIRLEPGSILVIPSLRTVQEVVFASQRRRESNP